MTDSQKWLVLAGLIATGWLTWLLLPVITPFAVSAVLAYLFDPLVDRLERRLSRTTGVLVIFALLTLLLLVLLLVLIPLLQAEVMTLVRQLPDLLTRVQQEWIPALSDRLGFDVPGLDMESLRRGAQENWRELGNFAALLLSTIGTSGQAMAAWVAWLLLIPVVTFYLLRDWDVLLLNVRELIPGRFQGTVAGLARECDGVLSEFLRGQLLVMLALSVIYATGLWIAGIEYALLIGLMAGMVSFVPYLGSIIGIGVAGAVAFFQYHDAIHLVYVAIVFGVGQSLEGMVLSPWLVGDRIGLHPVAVIFAVLAGGQLFGFTGILLALPVAAVCLVLLRFTHDRYKASTLST